MDITEIIAQYEGQTLEFKKSLRLRSEALEALCAMVNADRAKGTVIFGVSPEKTVCGVEPGNLDTAQRSLSQEIRSKFDPPLNCDMKIIEIDGKQVLILSATRHRSIPYHEYDGRAWIRQGSEKKLLTFTEKDHIRRSRDRNSHNGPWKCDRCGGVVNFLSSIVMTNEGIRKSYECDCGGEFWPF